MKQSVGEQKHFIRRLTDKVVEGANKNKVVVLCESLRLGVFAGDCLFLHSFKTMSEPPRVRNTSFPKEDPQSNPARSGITLRHARRYLPVYVSLSVTAAAKAQTNSAPNSLRSAEVGTRPSFELNSTICSISMAGSWRS